MITEKPSRFPTTNPNLRTENSSNVIFISIMATRLLLSLRKAAGPSRSSPSSEDFDLDLVTSVVFAGAQTTTEHGVEVGVSDA